MFTTLIKIGNYFINILLKIIKYMDFKFIMKIRNYLFKFVLGKMGKNCNICAAVTLISPKNISNPTNPKAAKYFKILCVLIINKIKTSNPIIPVSEFVNIIAIDARI